MYKSKGAQMYDQYVYTCTLDTGYTSEKHSYLKWPFQREEERDRDLLMTVDMTPVELVIT